MFYIGANKNDLLTHSDTRYVRTLWNSITKHIMQRASASASDNKECNLEYQQTIQ